MSCLTAAITWGCHGAQAVASGVVLRCQALSSPPSLHMCLSQTDLTFLLFLNWLPLNPVPLPLRRNHPWPPFWVTSPPTSLSISSRGVADHLVQHSREAVIILNMHLTCVHFLSSLA